MNLGAHELALLQELRSYLQSFSARTDLVSSKIPSLSLIPLVLAEISNVCKSCAEDSDEPKSLKTLIQANISILAGISVFSDFGSSQLTDDYS